MPVYRVPVSELKTLKKALGVNKGKAKIVPKNYTVTPEFHEIEVDEELKALESFKV